MELMKLRIKDMIYGPGETLILSFDLLDIDKPIYHAGQFITLIFNIRGRSVRRSYSLCSSPDVDEPLAVAIKRIENGEISRLLHHKTAIGDTLLAGLPNGLFTYVPNALLQRTVFMFGAGVGITPIFSIIKTALITERLSKLVLVYSSKSPADTLFYEELNELEKEHPERLKIIYLFSQAQNLHMARLNGSVIEQLVSEYLEFDKDKALFYTCGPVDYMVTCRIILLKLGYDFLQIKRETFVLPEDDADEDDTTEKVVKDSNTYSVNLNFRGAVYHIDVPYNKTILQVALSKKIDLPYSCRAGICSTCIAKCTKGNVRMDYNQVLMDDEIEDGSVLVCTGHPTENDTTIVW